MTTGETFSVRLIDRDIEPYSSIACEGLCCTRDDRWIEYLDRIGRENLRGVYRGSQLLGGLAFYRMGQWFGGREVGSTGVSGVAIEPAARGSGACAALLRSLLRELHDQQTPLSSLYASTQHLYRTVGFEQAGCQTRYSIPIGSLRATNRDLPVHRFESPPLETLDDLARQRAARTNGNLSRTEGLWQRMFKPHDGATTVTYLIGELERPVGYVILRTGSRDQSLPQPLVSTDLVANTPQAIHRLLSLISDHRSMCDSFEWYGPTNDSLIFFADEQWVKIKETMRWMLRIVHVKEALGQRGYPRSVSGTLHMEIEDELLTGNSGRWQLEISSGVPSVRRGGNGSLRMNVRALAPLYSSFYSARRMKEFGLLHCNDDQQLELATAAFAGDPAWLPEVF